MRAGTSPKPGDLAILVARCEVEPDFQVREMLTWAINRHPADAALPLVLAQLSSPVPLARSQALHTLSKIGDPAAWPHVTDALLHDADDEVARTAWRAAVVLVPYGAEEELATRLGAELGRGSFEVQRSLARALGALGEASEQLLERATRSGDAAVRAHATAALRVLEDPESTFYLDA
ncbi:HEAT repeat domain-containing protein [Leucobacter luti]|nr:HEAT repeat domain-containing protein [Leucobacter luti]MBL3700918.1 HEAT repeat domain-containing protein [Leucobacter luti]